MGSERLQQTDCTERSDHLELTDAELALVVGGESDPTDPTPRSSVSK